MAANGMQWPVPILPRQVHLTPAVQSKTGGLSLNGSEQVIVSDAGRWQAKVVLSLRGESSNLALRAFLAQMSGRAGTVLVPKWDLFRPVNANGRKLSQVHAVGYEDDSPPDGGSFNFDWSGFGQNEMPAAQLSALAVSGTTEISITINDGEGLRPGHYFGIGSRVYLASHVWQETVGGPTKVRFWPRLRATAASGEPVILDKPVCLMRFATDDQGSDMLSRRGSGSLALELVEAI